MKKIRYYVATLCTLLAMGSCNSLDIENIYNYDAESVWNDESLAEAYATNLYASLFGNWSPSADSNSLQSSGMGWYPDAVTVTNGGQQNWTYTTVRLVNEGLANLETSEMDETVISRLRGEFLFMRAYLYFNMLKAHGGIPYITTPQDIENDDLYVTRNTSAECFEYILKDLEDAISLLETKISSSDGRFGHIDGVFATAFKAKVLLRKASPQFNPDNMWDNAYWDDAYTATKAAYDLAVANGGALSNTYEEIFEPERGSETIFSVINSYPSKIAYWNYGCLPGSQARGNAWTTPTWEFVKEFPMADGKMFDDPTGAYYCTEDSLMQRHWKNRDPRFYDCIATNGSVWEISNTAGTGRRQYTAIGISSSYDDFGTNPNAGVGCENLNRYTGMFIRKAVNESLTQAESDTSFDTDYILMRFAEVMFMYAEAANETGHSSEAIAMLKEIRERAGIPVGDGNYGLDVSDRIAIREAILAERNVELCFEGHRYDDLRRLRMLDRLDGQQKHGIEAIAINADGTEMGITEALQKATAFELTEGDFKYVSHIVPNTGVNTFSVPDTYYFYPIYQNHLDLNENLEQNIGWVDGTFDPTL